MSDWALEVEGLGKQYRIGQQERYGALRDIIARTVAAPFKRKETAEEIELKNKTFWALRDVSLKIKRGEVLGVIGPNGAGKTTLLKLLSRVTEPTEGKATLHGRVGSLLEVGTGFHPELTGRENIYLSGAILGMQRKEIARQFDDIVEFSGVETFLDTPVKRYSSGMYVRLAFAVAAHLQTEILLVDEVLAVGDASFQQKCLGRMSEVAEEGRTIFFVSHNMSAIRSLCTKAVFLDGGRLLAEGTPDEVITQYLARTEQPLQTGKTHLEDKVERTGSGRVKTTYFEARSTSGNATPRSGAGVEFEVGYKHSSGQPIKNLHAIVTVCDGFGDSIFMCMPSLMPMKVFTDLPAEGSVRCKINYLPLIPGRYSVNLCLKDEEGVADLLNNAANFEIIDGGDSGFSTMPSGRWGKIIVPHEWEQVS